MAKSSDQRRTRLATHRSIEAAERLVKARRYDEAVVALERATRLDPGNPTVLYNLGVVHLAMGRFSAAIASLQRSIAQDPAFPQAHLILGLALQQSGRDEAGALLSYRRAIALEPEQAAEAYALVADLLWDNGERDEAIVHYERAARVAPDTTLARLCLAKSLTAEHRPDRAIEHLTELVVRDPSSGEAQMILGRLFSEMGRFDDAIASFERAIAMSPELAGAHHGLVSSRRLTQADRPWLARVLSQLEAPGNGVRQRMTLHFAAGKALDDLRDYAGAMRHFDAANAFRRKLGRPFDRAELGRVVDTLSSLFTPQYFRELTERGTDETPVLIVGLPRSGTTLVERIVSAHPQVAGGGEIVFWYDQGFSWLRTARDQLSEVGANLRAGYLRLLHRISPDALRVTDKNTFNWLWVGLVHLIFPRARIIHCRRDPIDTCLSIYTNALAYNWGFASDLGDLAAYYRLYLRMVAHWRAVLPSDRWLDVDYEDAVFGPEPFARQLIAFLGLPWDRSCLRPERNTDPVKTASQWQARQPIYTSSVRRWKNYEPWLGELRRAHLSADSAVNLDMAGQR
jgi:tetratricopeptide (TPR) repeat protein